MPYLLGQNSLQSYILTIFKQETYSSRYEKLPNIVIHACKKYRKNVFVENVWPATLALFIYVSTHCVETVKRFVYNPRLQQGFLCLIISFVVVVFLLFF